MKEDLREYRRINVIGTSRSGKSTFSERLAKVLGIPHLEMDAIFWQPNWQHLDDDEFLAAVATALEPQSWVLDGNYSRTTAVKWKNVQCVIWLDFPFLQTVARVLRRAINRSLSQKEIWPGSGNRETFRKCFFSADSVILWAITSYARNRRRYQAAMSDPRFKDIKFIRIRNSRELDALVEGFQHSL